MVSHVERIIPLKDAKEHRFPYETAKASRLRLAVGKEVITEDYYLKHTLPVMVELHGLEHELSEPNFTKTKIIVMSMDENKTDLIGELCDIFDISDTVLNTMLMTLTNNSGSTELDVLERGFSMEPVLRYIKDSNSGGRGDKITISVVLPD